jgi:REP element-mobilizing transposase RayT
MLGEIENGIVKLKPAGTIAEAHLAILSTHYPDVSVDRFVVMPNHVHALIQTDRPALPPPTAGDVLTKGLMPPKAGSLSAIIRSYKSGVSRAWHEAGLLDFSWQSCFHEHIVRSQASLEATRIYIEGNPKNWEEDPDR